MNASVRNLIRGHVLLLARYLHLDEFPIVKRQIKENNTDAISFWIQACSMRRMATRKQG